MTSLGRWWWCAEILVCIRGASQLVYGRTWLLDPTLGSSRIFVPPSPFPVVTVEVAKTSQILVEPISLMLALEGLRSPASLGTRWSLLISSWISSIPSLPQATSLQLPRITGQVLLEVTRVERSTAGGLDGSAWNEITANLEATPSPKGFERVFKPKGG